MGVFVEFWTGSTFLCSATHPQSKMVFLKLLLVNIKAFLGSYLTEKRDLVTILWIGVFVTRIWDAFIPFENFHYRSEIRKTIVFWRKSFRFIVMFAIIIRSWARSWFWACSWLAFEKAIVHPEPCWCLWKICQKSHGYFCRVSLAIFGGDVHGLFLVYSSKETFLYWNWI